VALEEMTWWDIFPYETDALRLKPMHPLLDAVRRRARLSRRGSGDVLVRDPTDLRTDLLVRRPLAARGHRQRALPSVGRTHLARWDDEGAHLHLWFIGRPARVGQPRGSPLVDWGENLPRVPREVADANAYAVAASLVAAYGGHGVRAAMGPVGMNQRTKALASRYARRPRKHPAYPARSNRAPVARRLIRYAASSLASSSPSAG